jgi:hypothetical protein
MSMGYDFKGFKISDLSRALTLELYGLVKRKKEEPERMRSGSLVDHL